VRLDVGMQMTLVRGDKLEAMKTGIGKVGRDVCRCSCRCSVCFNQVRRAAGVTHTFTFTYDAITEQTVPFGTEVQMGEEIH
jgi:hypothetical protein